MDSHLKTNSAVSHDLRSPLVNIQGFSRELAGTCATLVSKLSGPEFEVLHRAGLAEKLLEEIPESVQYILSSVAKMDSLLSGLLRFSRLGHETFKIGHLNMNRMMAEIARTMEFQIKQAGTTLRIGELPECLGDAVQITQVFSNLLLNAIKYPAPARPGLITVYDRTEDNQSIYVMEDNGMGIDTEHQEKVFEMFYRLNPETSQGEGLGLAIAQRILERHEEKLRLESEAGKSSRFFVTLPSSKAGKGPGRI